MGHRRRLVAVLTFLVLAAACGSEASTSTAAEGVPSQGGSNEDAFATFLTALGDGDRDLASTVAAPEALAADEWLGYDGLPNPAKPGHLTDAEGTLDGTTATYLLAPGNRLVCDLDDGVVVRCEPAG